MARLEAPDDRPRQAVLLAVIGLSAGVLSGMFGVGGGIVMVPAMAMGLGLAQRRAQAASLAAVVPIAAVGAFVFGRAENVHLLAAVLLAAGSLAGVQLGARVMHRTSDERLTRIFGVFLLVVAVTMFL